MIINFTRYARLIKQAMTDYRWFLFYSQRMLYHPNIRLLISSIITFFLPKTSETPFQQDVQIDQLTQTLKKDGLIVLENLVTDQQVAEMRSFLATKFCADPQRPDKAKISSPELAHSSCVHAYYEPDDIVQTPHLLNLANSPEVLSIVERVFGAKPTISLLQAWWLMAGFNVEDNLQEIYVRRPLEFHRDVDDWSEIKLFIYLTDVDEEAGPHAFIKKSHTWLLPFRKRVLELDDPSFPGPENLVKLTGKAGLAWLGNSYGLHRAMIPTKSHRLIVAITYSLFPLPFGPQIPLYQPKSDQQFDFYINRIYVEH